VIVIVAVLSMSGNIKVKSNVELTVEVAVVGVILALSEDHEAV